MARNSRGCTSRWWPRCQPDHSWVVPRSGPGRLLHEDACFLRAPSCLWLCNSLRVDSKPGYCITLCNWAWWEGEGREEECDRTAHKNNAAPAPPPHTTPLHQKISHEQCGNTRCSYVVRHDFDVIIDVCCLLAKCSVDTCKLLVVGVESFATRKFHINCCRLTGEGWSHYVHNCRRYSVALRMHQLVCFQRKFK